MAAPEISTTPFRVPDHSEIEGNDTCPPDPAAEDRRHAALDLQMPSFIRGDENEDGTKLL